MSFTIDRCKQPQPLQLKTMPNKTNLKGILLGASLGALTVISIAATLPQNPIVGRYQVAVGDGYIFKIDTMTGQVWQSSSRNPPLSFMAPNEGK